MNEVRVKLADGSERVGRWVTLDEWMAPLDKDHPARKELFALRMNLGSAMAQIDKLERLNASLHQQFIEEMAKHEQPNESVPATRQPADELRGQMAVDRAAGVDETQQHEPQRKPAKRTMLRDSRTGRLLKAPIDGGNAQAEGSQPPDPVD